jgi:hypothetical protein
MIWPEDRQEIAANKKTGYTTILRQLGRLLYERHAAFSPVFADGLAFLG